MKTHRTSIALIHETGYGAKIEFRRVFKRRGIIDLEQRQLKNDGNPSGEDWYPVTDLQMLNMQQNGSDIIQILSDLKE